MFLFNQDCGSLIERHRNNHKVCQLIFGGNTIYKKIYNILYKDSIIYLDRKFLKATKYYKFLIKDLP